MSAVQPTAELPRALVPWRALLELFPRELALSLGPWVQRLGAAVGPLRVRTEPHAGDPDGFDGLTRRGPYERLLLSEWLLADEVPAEFIRRAAMGEHAFLELARREPARARTSIALFDAGPDQLGGPRLVHLAALIVLARRAEAAGAEFGWGVLQAGDAPISTAVTPGAVRAMLARRSPRPVTAEDLAWWREEWPECDDVWLVGPPALASLPPARGAFHVAVQDVVEPGVRRVAVVVRAPGARRAELALDLPDDRTCARLIRDPFEGAAVPAPRRADRGAAPASNLLFSNYGSKLFARAPGGGVLAHSVPNSPRDVGSKPRWYQFHLAPVVAAVGHVGSRIVLVGGRAKSLSVHRVGKPVAGDLDQTLPLAPEAPPFAHPGATDALRPLGAVQYGPRVMLLVPDATGALFEVANYFEPPVSRVVEQLGGFAQLRDRVEFVGRGFAAFPFARYGASPPADPDAWALVSITTWGVLRVVPLEGDGTFATHFGCDTHMTGSSGALTAMMQRAERWTVRSAEPVFELEPPSASRVCGVAVSSKCGAGLVVLEPGERSVAVYGRNAVHRLPQASSPIVDVVASAAAPRIAYATARGELVVYSLETDGVLLRVEPAAGGGGA